MYEYVSDRERTAILQLRESKQPLALGQGGEGYIANDEWCYNCGNSGHLGDVSATEMSQEKSLTKLSQDCEELPHANDTPSAPSAFGLMNTLSGPFSDAAVAPVRTRAPRDWENGDNFGDGWGANAPINVGKRARNKERARMEQRALELEEHDPDDWFANPRNVRNRGARHAGGGGQAGPDAGGGGRGAGKKDAKIRIGRAWKSDDPPPSGSKPSLLERVSSTGDDDNDDRHSRGHRHGNHGRDRDRDRDRHHQHGRERDRDRDRRDHDRGGRERGRGRDHDRDGDRRDRDRGRDDGGRDGVGLRIRGSAGGTDASRHPQSEIGERKGRRREESRARSKDRERESRTGRDQGPRGPQYKGGYSRE